MNKKKYIIFALRIAMGWLLFYSGITKLLDSSWTSKGYLLSANTLPEFYAQLASPTILPIVDFLNQWGLTLIGAALIIGLYVRWAGILGAVLMLLYYIPVLDFPKIGENYYIVDQHIIFILVLLYLAFSNAGRIYGVEQRRY